MHKTTYMYSHDKTYCVKFLILDLWTQFNLSPLNWYYCLFQQPWCQQILIDLVITLNAYFASELSWNDDMEKDM